ncbi:hydrolase [Microbacterium suwonense]|uniref:Hydrolase n=1 Tax=Microbacterium suwonense TaxID=683047 RepID=A0ABM8FXW0_9MICO|nr:hydrolase [Microbacterium suwonense]BDZ40502.1 hypothetical protein GCM10025863_31160 [Microbacterium suwonense]
MIRHVDGGIVTGRFTDHHVHLQLVDHTLLSGSRLGRVVDLGGNPAVLRSLAGPVVEYAGPFLTAPGGYPSDRAWAPEGSIREIPDAASAAAIVAEVAETGACCIKIVAHSEAGPVLDDESFGAVVAAASVHGLPVVAHAEGAGQAQRAARLGASRLAHAPFSERLSDDEIAEQAASVEWVSTLAIHDDAHRAIAIDNVRRFADAGGVVLYGTDMGNGRTPVDLNTAEIDALREAGVDGIRLLHALAPVGAPALFLPVGDPSLARPLTPADLEA